ncbi:DNA mismatch repair protein MutS [Halarchaeum nitratireducens]|uniref:DNA mismatch repair protein MutS n=1 Tax=Halarchaeum nitratireducens TaxID=489913 RepID=A0A830GBP0_9EURY|nr:DNA mismatch repair protein MutS [Halarchaeum nitratireducens]GGN13313.1 DNA mismatch repair protein MutS [Halarchaeum nitratireducens]
MDAALGPPAAMADHREELTPMMAQYHDLCDEYDDSLVLFQVGDFYELFCEAAETAARILEITLTKREDSTGSYPMAGIPIDSAASYIEGLLEAGYRVAVADQVEDPDEASGIVERSVTRVVTPGTLTETELLRSDDNNFVASLTRGDEGYGLAFLDVSTGDFVATGPDAAATVRDEIARFDPAEAIVGPDADGECFADDCMVTAYDPAAFADDAARGRVADYFGSPDAHLGGEAEVRACGALLAYAEYTRGGEGDGAGDRLDYLTHLTRYDPREYMVLDGVALRSLELFERRSVHGSEGAALIDVLDETACALGGRRLKDWLRRPLVDADRIEARHDAVEELVADPLTRDALGTDLADVYDLERLISKVSRRRADARDLRSLKATLDVVPEIRATLAEVESERLRDLRARLDGLDDVRGLIGNAIRENPERELTEGGIIADGYDETLDELRETRRAGEQWIDDLEAQERERTGVDSLKVGHNSVHGYYIEVTNPNLDAVPENYERRQTLKNSERFVTPELKEREEEIMNASARADDRELDLFREVRREVGEAAERVQRVADALATVDALCSLAAVAAQYDYCRPTVGADGFEIEGGRHPVVERTEESFVPNDLTLTRESPLAVVTGPNMSGKSTYMRQAALVAVLAQLGSFVPARRARVPLVDRVFTRVGASDDIAGGRSTFMVEMTELADILRDATADSLVVLDEVGRGTSTADGYAIAQAVTERLHDEVGAYTLFATHHHDLTVVAEALDGARNLHFRAARDGDDVTFVHEVAEGAASASYGIEVAEQAGVPPGVVERARDVVAERAEDAGGKDAGEGGEQGASKDAIDAAGADASATADGGSADADSVVLDELAALNLAEMTPIQALTTLNRLQRELQ